MPFLVRLPIPLILSQPYFKTLGCRSRADVATLPRRDVETSRRCHVATWRRRDVAVTSHALLFIAPKTSSTAALFTPLYLYSKQTPNQESSHKNYIINIKICMKMEDRREYKMSVLGTHRTPKLSFLLVLKKELTLDRTHTLHIATNTKTVVHMLKNRGSIWTDSH